MLPSVLLDDFHCLFALIICLSLHRFGRFIFFNFGQGDLRIPRPLIPGFQMKTATGAAFVLAGLAATASAADLATDSATTTTSQCRVLPGDASWPSTSVWAALNKTIHGQLVSTVPLGSVCHDPTYNAAACAALQQTWAQPVTQ